MKKVVLGVVVGAMAFSADASVQVSDFSSVYGGLGLGGSFMRSTLDDSAKEDVKANRFLGSLVLGGGKILNEKMYIGGEFLADFMKNRTKHYDDSNIQMKGFIPQIDLKLGYAFRNNSLAYGKFGCAWSKISQYYSVEDKTYSKNKASFVVGLGAEKAFCKRFSTALEGDYNFGFKVSDNAPAAGQHIRSNKGWTVRALVKCHVKY